MLKDIIKKRLEKNQKKENDKIKMPVMDGFVDVKGYENGKMIYHDCGDNVVTDWMRHAIIMMLGGISFADKGNTITINEEGKNTDGYLLEKQQFLEPKSEINTYSTSTNEKKYALYPTKVLLGTGLEYHSWLELKAENQTNNKKWYDEMVAEFGKNDPNDPEGEAQRVFDSKIERDGETASENYNILSGTINKGIYSGEGLTKKCRTVNNWDTSQNVLSSTSMYKNYNVIGAIKTTYTGEDNSKLQQISSDSGRLLNPEWRGVGNPCFIYFNRNENGEETWNNSDSSISLSYDKDANNKYLTKITFKFNLISQKDENLDKYYPYNGYSLRQIGLYNDAQLLISPEQSPNSGDPNYYPAKNMSNGMLLAIKNILPIQKTDKIDYEVTWTLTI